MGTSSRSSSASRSRSLLDLTGRISKNIPEMFWTQAGNMAPTQGSPPSTGLTTGASTPLSPDNGEIVLTPHQHSSLNDLRSVAAYIKDTLTAAITDLRIDIQSVAGRVPLMERTHLPIWFSTPHCPIDTPRWLYG